MLPDRDDGRDGALSRVGRRHAGRPDLRARDGREQRGPRRGDREGARPSRARTREPVALHGAHADLPAPSASRAWRPRCVALGRARPRRVVGVVRARPRRRPSARADRRALHPPVACDHAARARQARARVPRPADRARIFPRALSARSCPARVQRGRDAAASGRLGRRGDLHPARARSERSHRDARASRRCAARTSRIASSTWAASTRRRSRSTSRSRAIARNCCAFARAT